MIAICVGHSRSGDKGAVSAGGISEHAYNSRLARILSTVLRERGLPNQVIDSYEGAGYSAAMRWVAKEVRQIGATVAVELHFNSAENLSATGHEWLFWAPSTHGRFLAQALDRQMRAAFPALKARGIKSIHPGDRGAEFLRLTPCPALICEPFFGSNESDWQLAAHSSDKLAGAIAGGLADWIGGAR